MASIFARDRRKSGTLELNEEPPEFEVMFLGKQPTERKMGRECTSGIVANLVEESRGKELKVVRITISARGLWVTEGSSKKKQRETFIPIYSISYGAADKHYSRVFSFVTNYSKNDPSIAQGRKSTMPFYCYGFLCKTPAIARAMVVYLLRSFKVAYESWRRGVKSQKLRDKIKAGPGHNSFKPIVNQEETSVAETIARLDQLTANNTSDIGSDSSQSGKTATPPNETATRSDKVMTWMDRWILQDSAESPQRISSDEKSSSASGGETATARDDENEAFVEREQECVDPIAMLNEEVDIMSELQDPEVRSVFEELSESKTVKKEQIAIPAS